MTTKWLSSQDALQHVIEHEVLPEVAERKLGNRVKKREIPCKAATLKWERGEICNDTVIPEQFWKGNSRLNLPAGTIEQWTKCFIFTQDGMPLMPIELVATASGVQLSERHLLQFWPRFEDKPESKPSRPHRPKGTGLASSDALHLEEMKRLIDTNQANSPTAAARLIYNKAPNEVAGAGTPESRMSRLVRAYKDKYRE